MSEGIPAETTVAADQSFFEIIGHRPKEIEIFYPRSELARRYNAEAPEPTPDPRVAYSDVAPREPIDPPEWPPE